MANPGTQVSRPSFIDKDGNPTYARFKRPDKTFTEADIYATAWEAKGWELVEMLPDGPTLVDDPVATRDTISPESSRRVKAKDSHVVKGATTPGRVRDSPDVRAERGDAD